METGLWVFVYCPIINYVYLNFGGWESKSQQFLIAKGLLGQQKDSFRLL